MESSESAAPTASGVDAAASAVSSLEAELIASETRSQFDAAFRRAQTLIQQIDADANLGPQERAAVDQHLRELLQRARIDYDRNREAAKSALAESVDRLALSQESLVEAKTIAEVQEVRADLRMIRESLSVANAWASRDEQTRVWGQWQQTNQIAWAKLNECWSRNEDTLTAVLDRTESDLERGRAHAAKAQIKQFHELAKSAEGSHAAMKRLRVRARELWNRATVASKEQHEAYVAIARKRLDYLRILADRAVQDRERIESEVSALELDLTQAQTDVAAALLRGRLDERRKQLRRVDAESAGLVRRIEETEKVVN